MRHRKSGRKLGRNSSHRRAMFRNMATSLIEEERIETTSAKAKELRSIVEKLITLGSKNAVSIVEQGSDESERTRRSARRVAAVRKAGRYVRNRDALQKLFGELAERFVGRPGGYTRILKTRRRLGDNAEMAIIELLTDADAASAPRVKAAPTPAPEPVNEPTNDAVEEAEEVVLEESAEEIEAASDEAVETVAETASEEAAEVADEEEEK